MVHVGYNPLPLYHGVTMTKAIVAGVLVCVLMDTAILVCAWYDYDYSASLNRARIEKPMVYNAEMAYTN